ncbi:MAG: hypothetical protein ABL871_12950 [Terricaulis sp.]
MTPQRDTLVAALQGIAKFHFAGDPSAQIESMDSSAELYARWHGAYIKRGWFLAQFSDDERAALAEFDAYFEALSAKYNKLPPILKFVTSADGKELCARAAQLLQQLST